MNGQLLCDFRILRVLAVHDCTLMVGRDRTARRKRYAKYDLRDFAHFVYFLKNKLQC
jgi:hypothetical protein